MLLPGDAESWTRPAIVPDAADGPDRRHRLAGDLLAITILTLLGILMLIGIVVNAAILIVERYRSKRRG